MDAALFCIFVKVCVTFSSQQASYRSVTFWYSRNVKGKPEPRPHQVENIMTVTGNITFGGCLDKCCFFFLILTEWVFWAASQEVEFAFEKVYESLVVLQDVNVVLMVTVTSASFIRPFVSLHLSGCESSDDCWQYGKARHPCSTQSYSQDCPPAPPSKKLPDVMWEDLWILPVYWQIYSFSPED